MPRAPELLERAHEQPLPNRQNLPLAFGKFRRCFSLVEYRNLPQDENSPLAKNGPIPAADAVCGDWPQPKPAAAASQRR
jgi:hypothetical protein